MNRWKPGIWNFPTILSHKRLSNLSNFRKELANANQLIKNNTNYKPLTSAWVLIILWVLPLINRMSSWLTLRVSDLWCLTFASTIAHSLQYSFMITSLANLSSYFQGESNPDRADLCWPHEPKQHYHLHNLITNAGVPFINHQSPQSPKNSEHPADLKFF